MTRARLLALARLPVEGLKRAVGEFLDVPNIFPFIRHDGWTDYVLRASVTSTTVVAGSEVSLYIDTMAEGLRALISDVHGLEGARGGS